MPKGVMHCCFTPFDMSFHLFKPDGKYDSLYRQPITVIRYEPTLKTYNYSLDIDYFIQKMVVNAEIEKQRKIKDALLQARVKDSLEMERQYIEIIVAGNLYFVQRKFTMAQQMFEKALVMKPMRKYPAYKIEDIKTELEIFNKRGETLTRPQAMMSVVKPSQPPPPPIATYRRKTRQELEAMFRNDLTKQVVKESKDQGDATRRLAFVNKVLDKKKTDTMQQPVALVVRLDTSHRDTTVKHLRPLVMPELSIAPEFADFDEEAYQDSLRKKYFAERTIELLKEDMKTITKVILNQDDKISIYLKVEHIWGATFYFRDNYPYPMENISKSYFEVTTKLLSDRDSNSVETK
jgi:tetratricopeptide (TPR) repeat protein